MVVMRQSDTKVHGWLPPLVLAAGYVALAYGGAWLCWGIAAVLLWAAPTSPLAAVPKVLGTLMPLFATYMLYPQLRKLEIGPWACAPTQGDDPRSGFFRAAFGMRPSLRGLLAFALLLLWRWAMFRIAFGFPATPADALANAWANAPVLLLGGGLEEIGWRGCLQPALTRALRGLFGPSALGGACAVLGAPLITGIVWGLWHAPLCVLPNTFQNNVALWTIVGVGVALSYSFGALSCLDRNLDGCVLSHAWYNAMLVSTPAFGPIAWGLFGLEAIVSAVVLCFVMLYKTGHRPHTVPVDQ